MTWTRLAEALGRLAPDWTDRVIAPEPCTDPRCAPQGPHPADARHCKHRHHLYDEAHTYRGVFGSHVANVLRRLRRIAARYGAEPRFVLASATIANPVELAEGLVGRRFQLVDSDGAPKALCWVSTDGDIGPAIGQKPADVIPVVLAALDRVAKAQEPRELGIYASTTQWHLLHRLRVLGFRVYWPSWIMCSIPLPGLDRYVPTRPPFVL